MRIRSNLRFTSSEGRVLMGEQAYSQAGSAMMAEIDDYDAIAGVIKTYIDGAGKGDIKLLSQIFHEKARLFGEGPPQGKTLRSGQGRVFQGPGGSSAGPSSRRQVQGASCFGAAARAISDRHRAGRRVLGPPKRVVRRHLLAVQDWRPVEDCEQDLHVDGRRGLTRSTPGIVLK